MSKEKWTLFGAGEYFLDVVTETIELNGGCVTHLVFNQKVSESLRAKLTRRHIEILPLEAFKPETDKYFFGYVNADKQAFLKDLAKFDIHFANLIHPLAYISPSVTLGQGNYVSMGSVIDSAATIGNFNTINRSVSIGHHTYIGDFNHVGPGAIMTSKCSIGNGNFLGAGSIMIDGITIANDVVLGAGAVTVKDILEPGTYVGIPAKRLDV